MIDNKYVSPVNVVYFPVVEEWSIYYEEGFAMHKGDSLWGGRIVEGDQVDHAVLGTVGPCILKVLLLAFTILHCNIQKQKGIDSYMSYGTCCICTGISCVCTCWWILGPKICGGSLNVSVFVFASGKDFDKSTHFNP